ncbi:MAG TPA: DUF4136 domain-containing protein [Panacibacter sp.]|nr:DUF4136 domain-containing protein [Panacibacter sp.]HNP43807.1 DUF4136 domain-containing protein [Panacibacter sp.]
MKSKGLRLFVMVAIVVVNACSPGPKIYNAERLSDKDFRSYKTYAFSRTTDTAFTVMINKKQLEEDLSEAVVAELTKKGLKMDTKNPDCIFTYTLKMNRKYAVNQQQEVVYSPNYYPGFYGNTGVVMFSSDNRPAVYNGKMNIDTLREGSFIIDMIDPKEGKVVWRSTGQAEKKESYKQPSKDVIDQIIKDMFKNFPKK